jgi:hypothetical protein
MKLIIAAAITVAIATGAFAQDGQAGSHNPAIKNSDVHGVGAPAMGHSSFTERQAQGRIAKAGFTHVGALTKTDAGIWQGRAMKHGRSVMVMLDYKGNVSAR